MGKKTAASSSKSKEKRQARKQEQHRIADHTKLVTSANKLTNLNSICQDLLLYKNKDFEVDMFIQRVTELDKKVLDWAIELTEQNMKVLYNTCSWGWDKERKVKEMTDDSSIYLIAKAKNGDLLGYSHFRFDMDYGDPVLYCYEVQIEVEGRRKGIGQRVMSVLETLARATHMHYVRLTVLNHNPAAAAFFKSCGYELDETSPGREEAAHYEILSKATNDSGVLSAGIKAVHVEDS